MSQRLFVQEQMDDFTITDERLTLALEQLPQLNTLLGTYKVIKDGLGAVIPVFNSEADARASTSGETPAPVVSILDVGSGIGDIPIMVSKWAADTGRCIRIVATDANEFTVDFARRVARARQPTAILNMITFEVANALELKFEDNSFDYVIATQLLHHFTHEEASRCVSEMNRVSRFGLLVNDLHRHPVAYHSIKVIVKLLSMSPMIVNDAPISVHRGFVRRELDAIAVSSSLAQHRIRWHLPFRWSLSTLVGVG